MLRWALAVLATAAGCGDDDCCSASVDAAVDATPDARPPPNLLYLNRLGGQYSSTSGASSSISNTFRWLDMPRTFAPWPHDDANWASVTACIATGLAPFDVTITEIDPSPMEHHELVFSDVAPAFGTNVPSIAEINCSLATRDSLSAVFGTPIGTDVAKACSEALAAFAIASVGLDNVIDCRDFLGAFQPPCGAKAFRDLPLKCGTQLERSCTCGAALQNSFQVLMSWYGPR